MSKDTRSETRKSWPNTLRGIHAVEVPVRRMRPRALTPDEAADLAAGLDENEVDERIEAICLAPTVDGSVTLSEAAFELHAFALWLADLERDGWQMVEDAGGDAHLRVINADRGKRVYPDDD